MSDNTFSNLSQNDEQLPMHGELEYQRLSAKYASTNVKINTIIFFAILSFMLAVYIQPFIVLNAKLAEVLPYIAATITVLGSVISITGYYADKLKSYALRELDLHYASGLFFKKVVSQPITRIQHIELKRGPIDRKIGLAKLQVFSAGGSMHTFEIPGLPLATAQQIRQFILEHKDVAKHG